MRIELNGEPAELQDGATVADAVVKVGGDPRRRGIAVAIDSEVLPRGEWESTRLGEGQSVEIVTAIQGG